MHRKLILGLFVIAVLFVGLAARPPQAEYSEKDVVGVGHSQGNHRLDCLVIRPWDNLVGPGKTKYPVIVWANGWGGNDNAGENTSNGYKPGLIEWALNGPYIVIAANQWSVQESDVLACLQWIVNQNVKRGSEYYGVINTSKIGLAGHSQGGGAVIKAGDGEPNGFVITSVIAMNPYGPSWIDAEKQDGLVMLLGGTADAITPVSSFTAVWEAIQINGQGGLLAVLDGGDHSSDAWGPPDADPNLHNFGNFQEVSELWWQYTLKGKVGAGKEMMKVLGKDPWITEITDGTDY